VRAALASIASAYLRVPPQQPSSARLPGAKASGGPVSYAPDMDVRLVQLLGSFIAARIEYVLARLEFAALHPDFPAPPNIDRLPDASERTLRERWPFAASDLAAARLYLAEHRAPAGESAQQRDARARLERTLRELDGYARAILWVQTVEERESSGGNE